MLESREMIFRLRIPKICQKVTYGGVLLSPSQSISRFPFQYPEPNTRYISLHNFLIVKRKRKSGNQTTSWSYHFSEIHFRTKRVL